MSRKKPTRRSDDRFEFSFKFDNFGADSLLNNKARKIKRRQASAQLLRPLAANDNSGIDFAASLAAA